MVSKSGEVGGGWQYPHLKTRNPPLLYVTDLMSLSGENVPKSRSNFLIYRDNNSTSDYNLLCGVDPRGWTL